MSGETEENDVKFLRRVAVPGEIPAMGSKQY